MRVLLIGFGPFPGAPANPSAALVEALARHRRPALAGIDIAPHVFPTVYAAVDRDLPKLFAAKPDVVLLFGLAARRRAVSIETRARNAISVLFPDAGGTRAKRGVIVPGEPSSRRGNAPFAKLLSVARASAVPAKLSRDAGRYLCNYGYWRALERARHGRPLIAFIHIPAVRAKSRRRSRSRRAAPTLANLVVVAEALLMALVTMAK
jgi:pyroglutamyl-peptidase